MCVIKDEYDHFEVQIYKNLCRILCQVGSYSVSDIDPIQNTFSGSESDLAKKTGSGSKTLEKSMPSMCIV